MAPRQVGVIRLPDALTILPPVSRYIANCGRSGKGPQHWLRIFHQIYKKIKTLRFWASRQPIDNEQASPMQIFELYSSHIFNHCYIHVC